MLHDLDFYTGLNCCQIDLKKLFDNGFSTGEGHIRSPNSIVSYASLCCIILQSNQNDQFGGQSVPKFDYDMAPGVAKSYAKIIEEYLLLYNFDQNKASEIKKFILDQYKNNHTCLSPECIIKQKEFILNLDSSVITKEKLDEIYDFVFKKLEKEVYQGMQIVIHNLNSMHCLPGSERIWVFDKLESKFECIEIATIYKNFEYGRWFVISLNRETGESEFKEIMAVKQEDNHRRLVTLISSSGQKITTTDNHLILTYDGNNIIDKFPEETNIILSPINIDNIITNNITDEQKNNIKNYREYKASEIVFTSKSSKLKNYSDKVVFNTIKNRIISNSDEEYVYDISVADNENFLTEDCIFVHNSRAGSQVPFSSLNYGTDTTEEGRMVIKQILLALDDGLGGGETPIFPIHIFKCKRGINFDPGDPNYDLYKLSLKVSAKRLFPNWSFIDAPYNLQYYVPGNPDTEVAVMG